MQQPKMFLLQVTQLVDALLKEFYDISLLPWNCNLNLPFSLVCLYKS